jgi:hypothetical protein
MEQKPGLLQAQDGLDDSFLTEYLLNSMALEVLLGGCLHVFTAAWVTISWCQDVPSPLPQNNEADCYTKR